MFIETSDELTEVTFYEPFSMNLFEDESTQSIFDLFMDGHAFTLKQSTVKDQNPYSIEIRTHNTMAVKRGMLGAWSPQTQV